MTQSKKENLSPNTIATGELRNIEGEADCFSQTCDSLAQFELYMSELDAHSERLDDYIAKGNVEGHETKKQLSVKLYSKANRDALELVESNLERVLSHCLKGLSLDGKTFEVSVINEILELYKLKCNDHEYEAFDYKREIKHLTHELDLSDNTAKKLSEQKHNLEKFKDNFRENGKKGGKRIKYEDYYELVRTLVHEVDLDPFKRGYVAKIVKMATRRILDALADGIEISEPSEKQAENIVKKVRDSIHFPQ